MKILIFLVGFSPIVFSQSYITKAFELTGNKIILGDQRFAYCARKQTMYFNPFNERERSFSGIFPKVFQIYKVLKNRETGKREVIKTGTELIKVVDFSEEYEDDQETPVREKVVFNLDGIESSCEYVVSEN